MNTAPRVLFALPGLHAVNRGAEVAFEAIASRLASDHGFDVTLMGSGNPRPDQRYRFIHVGRIPRENFRRWPHLPCLRADTAYEEASFAAAMLRRYRPSDYDLTVTCGYPYLNWLLRSRRRSGRPRHVYVTQNGDWACHRSGSEFRWFDCDLLVCTNPEYFESHSKQYGRIALIPNGVDPMRFCPGPRTRSFPELLADRPVVLVVSALIPSKRVIEGIRAVAKLPDVNLLIAGGGPLADAVDELGRALLPGRFLRRTFHRDEMPELFRSADVFLHMSQDEPSANAYIEALATGVPVVTHDRMVTRWTFDGTACLVDTSDLDAVAKAICSSLPPFLTADRTRSVSLARSRYDWNIIASQYAASMRELLQQ